MVKTYEDDDIQKRIVLKEHSGMLVLCLHLILRKEIIGGYGSTNRNQPTSWLIIPSMSGNDSIVLE